MRIGFNFHNKMYISHTCDSQPLWNSTYGETCETKGYLCSIDSFLVTYQDCILIIQNISFPKILYNPKLKWHFRIKCLCQLKFIFVFESVTCHIDTILNTTYE